MPDHPVAQDPQSTPASGAAPADARAAAQTRLARALFVLIALVFLVRGGVAVATGEWHGTTKQGNPLDLVGAPARWMGGTLVAIAGLPLAALVPDARRRLQVAIGSAIALVVTIVMGVTAR